MTINDIDNILNDLRQKLVSLCDNGWTPNKVSPGLRFRTPHDEVWEVETIGPYPDLAESVLVELEGGQEPTVPYRSSINLTTLCIKLNRGEYEVVVNKEAP